MSMMHVHMRFGAHPHQIGDAEAAFESRRATSAVAAFEKFHIPDDMGAATQATFEVQMLINMRTCPFTCRYASLYTCL